MAFDIKKIYNLDSLASFNDSDLFIVHQGGSGPGKKTRKATYLQLLDAFIAAVSATTEAIELRNNGTHIQWKYVATNTWIDLIALADITGADGQSVEMRSTNLVIQWRYAGDANWIDLLDLAELKGDPGDSAYEIALTHGFSGTEQEWLDSLKASSYSLISPDGTKQASLDNNGNLNLPIGGTVLNSDGDSVLFENNVLGGGTY